ncbi:MAG: MBL fold metallo-hydrolase, partial [Acidobacteria bacterium]|nr:MBL fold metallo-hydrolase [Acidobacteriota bacterium]
MTLTRRQFVLTSSLAFAGGVLPRVAIFGQQPAPPPTKTSFETLRDSVGIFNGRGGTIGWFVSPDGVVVIDSQFPDTAQACLDGLKQRSPRQIDALINTHHHGDHSGGNAVFRPAAKKIVAHAKVPGLQKAQAAQAGNEAGQVYPDTTFEDAWKMQLGTESL